MSSRAEAIVIGASAGAIEALSVLLPSLPQDFALPILIVVHVPLDKGSLMADLFAAKCKLEVCEAEDKAPIRRGVVYFAPADYHLLVEADKRLSLSSEEPVNYSRPSIDVLLETAADAYEDGLVGVVLTGANSDGAKGLRRVCKLGGRALVQRPDAAYAAAMPEAALAACPAAEAMTLEQLAETLKQLGVRR